MMWLAVALGLVCFWPGVALAADVLDVLGSDGGGVALGAAGDLDGDGCGELLVGSPLAAGVFPDEGGVALWSGGRFAAPAWRTLSGRPGSAFGASVARAGDVDGDGFADFIVGAPLDSRKYDREGRAWVYFGGPDGVSNRAPWFNEGEAEDARFGASAIGVGDVDDDGFSDLLVAAPGPPDAAFPGRVELFLGGPTGPEPSSELRLDGANGDRLGAAIAPLWDLDRDGFADFAVGAPGGDGRIEVWHGGEQISRGATLSGEPGEGLGAAFSGVGDMDGDDRAELAVYRPAFGAVWIFPGANLDQPPWVVSLSSFSNMTELSLSPLGDYDGDGYADLLVASKTTAIIIHGGRGGPRESRVSAVELPAPNAPQTERWLVGVGDVTCDGLGDLGLIELRVMGDGEDQAVSIKILAGRPALVSSVAWTIESLGLAPTPSKRPFVTLDGGDLDGDGLSDAVIGLPDLDRPGKPGAGATYVFYGDHATGLVDKSRAWSTDGERAGDRAGFAAAAGDIDGDGFGDLAIGAPGVDGAVPDVGRIDLWRGSDEGPTFDPRFTLSGDRGGLSLGTHLTAPGDVDGDGLADLVVCRDRESSGRDDVTFFFGQPSGLAERINQFVENACSSGALPYPSVAAAGDALGTGLGQVLSLYDRPAEVRLDLVGLNQETSLERTPPLDPGPMGVAGDVDGDGRDDVFYVDFGGDGPTVLRLFMAGATQDLPELGEGFGEAVAAPGDIDLDGHADLLVAAPRGARGGEAAGVIWLFRGGPGGLMTEPTVWRVGAPGERLGLALGAVGDVDGDGRADVLVARGAGGLSFDLHLSGDLDGSRPRDRGVALVHPDTLRRLPLGSGQSAPIEVGLNAAALSLIGPRAEVRLEITAARYSEPFEAGVSAKTAPIAPAAARAGLFAKVGPLVAETAYKVRGRLLASPRMAPLQVASRWVTPIASGKPTSFAVRTRRNRPPSVVADFYQTTMGIGFQTLGGAAGRESLLHNDADPDNDTLSARLTTPPRGGEVAVMLDNGEFFYVPHDGFWGRDTFTYTADDGVGGQSLGEVVIDVTPTGACGGLTEGRCESGDYEVVFETASGRRSARCWLESGEVRCRTRADNETLALDAPRCE